MLKLIKCQTILLVSLMQLTFTSAWGEQPVCNTIADCLALDAKVEGRIHVLRLNKEFEISTLHKLDFIARDSDRKVMRMSQYDAAQYCATRGLRLPSARELAKLSMSFGSKGIVDTCSSDNQCIKLSNIQNADGSIDNFSFSSAGFQNLSEDLEISWLWSSSIYLPPHGSQIRTGEYAYGLVGDASHGEVSAWHRNYKGAVWCVANYGPKE